MKGFHLLLMGGALLAAYWIGTKYPQLANMVGV